MAMANENARFDLQAMLMQLASIDPVVAIDVALITGSMLRSGDIAAREAAAAAAPPQEVQRAGGKIAVIGVYGGLSPRGSWFGSSLEGIRSAVTRFAADADIGAIVLDIDSPGGTVAGTVEAANAVKAAAAIKPVVAIANTLSASAAYWIGSQAGEFVIGPSGDVGSIGAMVMHVDVSKALAEYGMNVTLIRSEQSPLKNEAHPFGPLSEQATAFLQSRVNEAGADFIKAVAGGRRVTQAKVKEEFGQGRVFGSREAVSRGMADRVATLDQVITGIAAKMPAPASRPRRRSAIAFE
jgi:signal peptide peptidase SppA